MQGFRNLVKHKWFPFNDIYYLGSVHFGNPEVSKLGDIMFVYYIGTGLFLGY
jgi:hypothetical protein